MKENKQKNENLVPDDSIPSPLNNIETSNNKSEPLNPSPKSGGYTDNSEPPKVDKGIPFTHHPQRGIRFGDRTPEELRAIGAAGGRAGKGVTRKRYSRCMTCEMKSTCRRAFEESRKKHLDDNEARCVYEMENRRSLKDGHLMNYRAFVSSDPVDLLAKIQSIYTLLEEEVKKDVTYTKLTNLLYLMMNIYRLKFGEKAFLVNVNKNLDNNASLDIKDIMQELRQQEQSQNDEVIDVTPHPVSNNGKG